MGSGTNSGRGTVSMPRGQRNAATGRKEYDDRTIESFVNRLSFKDVGNGEWTIEHPAFGGAQILAGTNPYYGWNTYEVRVWDSDYNMETVEKFTTLNDAKTYAKRRLESNFDPEKANR